MRIFFALLTYLLLGSFSAYSQHYLHGHLYAKYKAEINNKKSYDKLQSVLDELEITTLEPFGSRVGSPNLKTSNPNTDLSRLIRIYYDADTPPEEACKKLMATGQFDYVEPHHIFEILHVPNDPFADSSMASPSRQDQLIKHKAYEAWDIEQGDTNMVIGIVDAGFLLSHEDLNTQVKYNQNDPVNGVNDDGDFYFSPAYPLTDNYAGWDIADFDPDVSSVVPHGTLVAGCSSGAPNNSLGIAGTGYKCKFLPVKASTDASPNFIQYGYDGLLYAAQHGCKVINLSWGSPNSYSQAVQDLINYIVIELDVTIVAAAGNVPTEQADYYPACYDNVISVASTRIGNAMYGKVSYYVDLNALGRNVRTSDGDTNDDYVIQHGSSYSSPIVAGAIALVRAQRPHLNARQAGEQVRITGDVVDTLDWTVAYKERMGRSLNMHRAVTDSTLPSIRVVKEVYSTKDGNLTYTGDTVEVDISFLNFLANTTSTDVTISIIGSNAEMIDSTFNLGSVSTLDSAHQTFSFYLESGASDGDTVLFRAGFSDPNYEDHEYFVWIVDGNNQVITSTPKKITTQVTAVYPNPYTNKLFVSINKPTENQVKYTLLDMESRIIKKGSFQSNDTKTALSLPEVPSGMYILKLSVDDEVSHHKVLKL